MSRLNQHGRPLKDRGSANVFTSQNRGDISFGPEMDKAPTTVRGQSIDAIYGKPKIKKIPRFDTTLGSETRRRR